MRQRGPILHPLLDLVHRCSPGQVQVLQMFLFKLFGECWCQGHQFGPGDIELEALSQSAQELSQLLELFATELGEGDLKEEEQGLSLP